MQQPGNHFQRSWKTSNWLLGGWHHHLCLEWYQKRNCQKSHWLWDKRTKQNYHQMLEQWCSFCHKRGLAILEICLSDLVEYLDYLQVTLIMPTWLCMHASAISSILQPTGQTRASMAPLVKQLLTGVFRKNPPARVWADTWDIKKVLNLLHVWGKPSVLKYTPLTLKMVMILALPTVKRPSDLSLFRITPKAMQITEDSVTFQLVFGAKNARPKHLYWPTITVRWAEDECLCSVMLIKEYIASWEVFLLHLSLFLQDQCLPTGVVVLEDREDQSEKLFVTRKISLAVAVAVVQLPVG